MSWVSRRTAGTVIAAAAVLPLTTSCSAEENVTAPARLGNSRQVIEILIDTPAVPTVRCAIKLYLRGKPLAIKFGGGPANDIATAVKNGEQADVVILPAGPGLERVRDELATRPTTIAATSRPLYWVAAVTDRGLEFTRFLSSPENRRAFRLNACARG